MTHELILGGQRSGKSRCAEARAAAWLAQPGCSAVLLATAEAGDDEMRERIERHRADRSRRLPRLACVEASVHLPQAIGAHSAARRLVVVDCLTLWLTRLRLPPPGRAVAGDPGDAGDDPAQALCRALAAAPGPVVLVSNEIGSGVVPLEAATRRFVDELGHLHQAVAAQCGRVTLMVAGLELRLKDAG